MKKEERDIKKLERLKTTSYQPDSSDKGQRTEPDKPKRKLTKKSWIKRVFLFVILAGLGFVLVVAGLSARNFQRASEHIFGEKSVLGLVPPTELRTDAANRTNILLIGNATDRDAHGGADLTDTILILSLAASAEDAYMLSIPRDLYVNIPSYGTAKINEAFPAGERHGFQQIGYRADGVGLLERVVTENFGLEVHYAMVVNFSAVEDIVDALGGITVTIDSPDDRGIYDPNFQPHEGGPLQLENGVQQIDGQTALRLTRARDSTSRGYGFPQSDFNRTKNQQEVIKGITSELDWRLALDPRKNGVIFDSVAANIETDISMSEVIPLYRKLVNLPITQMDSYTLRDIDGVNYLQSYTTTAGLSALIPTSGLGEYDEIRQAIRSIHQ